MISAAPVSTAVFDADRGRKLQVPHSLLSSGNARAQVQAFQARGDLHVALQVVSKNFGLAWQFGDCGQRAERRRSPAELTSTVLLMASSEARLASGNRTRKVYGRSLITTGVVAGSPSTIAELATASCPQ